MRRNILSKVVNPFCLSRYDEIKSHEDGFCWKVESNLSKAIEEAWTTPLHWKADWRDEISFPHRLILAIVEKQYFLVADYECGYQGNTWSAEEAMFTGEIEEENKNKVQNGDVYESTSCHIFRQRVKSNNFVWFDKILKVF